MTDSPKQALYSDAVIESAARAGYEAVNARLLAQYGSDPRLAGKKLEGVSWDQVNEEERQRSIRNARILADDKDTAAERQRMIEETDELSFDLFSNIVDAMLQAEDRYQEQRHEPKEPAGEEVPPRRRAVGGAGKPFKAGPVLLAFMNGLGQGFARGLVDAAHVAAAETDKKPVAADGSKPKCEHPFHEHRALYLPCPGCGEKS